MTKMSVYARSCLIFGLEYFSFSDLLKTEVFHDFKLQSYLIKSVLGRVLVDKSMLDVLHADICATEKALNHSLRVLQKVEVEIEVFVRNIILPMIKLIYLIINKANITLK